MKNNQKLLHKDKIQLEKEINRSKQLMKEDYTVVNSADLGDNRTFSPHYHINKGKGKSPYNKMGYILSPESVRSYN